MSGNEICKNYNNNNNLNEFRITLIFYIPSLKSLNRLNINNNERNESKEFFNGKLTSDILEKKLGCNFNTKNLIELDLSSLKLKDEISLFSKENYPKLKKLNLSRNNFKSFSIFGVLPNLIELNLNYNFIVEIFPKKEKLINGKGLFGLPNLESLELRGNQIVNLNGIQFLKGLKILVLSENNFTKIESINNMNNLTFLDVSTNKLRNLDKISLGNLPNIQIIIADNNMIKNINNLKKYSTLTCISFENNKIIDFNQIEELKELKSLKEINLSNNPISKSIHFRYKMIKSFPFLLKLDGKEISNEEKDLINMEMQLGNYPDDPYYVENDFLYNKNIYNNYNPNIQKTKNFLNLTNQTKNYNNNINNNKKINLPNIKQNYNKPSTSENNRKKIIERKTSLQIQNNNNNNINNVTQRQNVNNNIINNKYNYLIRNNSGIKRNKK